MAASIIEKKAQGTALILAALFSAASTFYWQNGEYSVIASTLLIFSVFFWIPAFIGLFNLVRTSMPRYTVFGFWIAVLGCVSGICFAFLGYLVSIFEIDHKRYLEVLSQYPVSSQLLLFGTGPLFPLSVVVLGIILIINKKIPAWQGIIFSLAGALFPFGRITRTQSIAHGADLLFLIACTCIAQRFFKRKDVF